jgi:hypothetical protein
MLQGSHYKNLLYGACSSGTWIRIMTLPQDCRQQASSEPQGEGSASVDMLMQRSGGQAAGLNQEPVVDGILPVVPVPGDCLVDGR